MNKLKHISTKSHLGSADAINLSTQEVSAQCNVESPKKLNKKCCENNNIVRTNIKHNSNDTSRHLENELYLSQDQFDTIDLCNGLYLTSDEIKKQIKTLEMTKERRHSENQNGM